MKEFRDHFPILTRQINGKALVYLDSAATSQKPTMVIERAAQLYAHSNANIHRGIHTMANECTAEYEQARAKIAKFIGANSPREIVFTSGATASINLVAHSFSQLAFTAGDNIIISEMEHHANIVPWQLVCERYDVELRVLSFNDEGELEIEKLSQMIDQRTRLVAITETSNILGTNNDIARIAEIVHQSDAKLLVDGCQGIVHCDTNVQDIRADFYAFSAHKLYGPTGLGVLWAKEELLEAMPPFMGGGDMISTVSLTKGSTWAELPLKFEAGTSNYIGAIVFAKALDFLEQFDSNVLHAHCTELYTEFAERLTREIDGVRIYGTAKSKAPICSFNIEGVHPMDLAQIIDKLGVAMRSGTHCGEPIMTHYGVESMCRASFAPYNTQQEVHIAIEALKRAASMLK